MGVVVPLTDPPRRRARPGEPRPAARRTPGLRGAALAGALLALAACRSAPAPPPAGDGPSLVLEDVAYSEYEGARPSRRLTAAQLLVVPKRLGLFQVTGLNELVLTRPRFEILLDARAPSPAAVPRDLFGVALVRAPAVASAVMFDLECVLRRDGRPLTRLSASRASVDVRTGDVSFRDFRMASAGSPRALHAARAEWRAADRRFAVRGEYDLEGGEPRHGRGLEVDVALGRVGPP